MKKIIFLLVIIPFINLYSQFTGGSGDGFSYYPQFPITGVQIVNPYSGGSGDGFSYYPQFPISGVQIVNPYAGGSGDGFSYFPRFPLETAYLTFYLQGLWNGTIHKPCPVTVELRSGSTLMTSSLVIRKAALMNGNGTVYLDFSDAPGGTYYLIVRSAGYMPLAMPGTITFTNFPFSYNFTTASTQAICGSFAMIQIGNSWQMRAGDYNSSRSVNSQDLNILLQNNGKSVSGQVPPP